MLLVLLGCWTSATSSALLRLRYPIAATGFRRRWHWGRPTCHVLPCYAAPGPLAAVSMAQPVGECWSIGRHRRRRGGGGWRAARDLDFCGAYNPLVCGKQWKGKLKRNVPVTVHNLKHYLLWKPAHTCWRGLKVLPVSCPLSVLHCKLSNIPEICLINHNFHGLTKA